MVIDFAAARRRLKDRLPKTPIMSSSSISSLAKCEVLFKCEHLQKTGSFKTRGATNAIIKMVEEGRVNGVITYSTGNHGMGVAWAAREAGVPALVVCSRNAPSTKKEAIVSFGAELFLTESNMGVLSSECTRLAKERNLIEVVPFNDEDVISGQGTIAAEILEEVPDVEAIFLSIGGGGLAAGVQAYLLQINSNIQLYVVEPEGKELEIVFKGEKPTENGKDTLDTIADGIRAKRIGDLCLPILRKKAKVITVTEEEIVAAQRHIWHYLKQVVEPSAAVPLAGLLKATHEYKKVAVVLCGGNIAPENLPGYS